jgi:2-isopropylmalate synthase
MTTELETAGLIVNHNRLKELRPPALPDRVWIWDETLRDGEQTAGTLLTIDEKIAIAKLMDEIGVAVIAAGFPMVSKQEYETIRRLSKEDFRNASLAAPARAVLEDVKACVEAGAQEIPIFIACSRLRLEYQLRMTLDEAIDRLVECTQYARDHGVKADYVVEDATRSDLGAIARMAAAAVDAGAEKVVIADTVGFCRPNVMRYIIEQVRRRMAQITKRQVTLGVHCHDDFGLATANTLAAVEAGVTFPHVCVNGFGERAGNAAFEEVVMALEVLYGVQTGVKTERLYDLAQLVERSFAIPIPVHKAIVGQNAFHHGSGIHVHAQLAHSLSYEPILPEQVGRQRSFYLGKFAGRHLIEFVLKKNGITASEAEISRLAEAVKRRHADQDKRAILARFDRCRADFAKLKADLTEEELLTLARAHIKQVPEDGHRKAA